ncbi:hypothetical protein GH714_001781 [Hevea brasiliensis]|uniref:Lysosomal Pro-X carboxypeptidase n=1 Tax=Hevea brasiliensis TaxID=3981 RepID=A0A6A6NA48_HEVBR|nr:hypothetical protein GH714_001781 [Hevea brasiliensis]
MSSILLFQWFLFFFILLISATAARLNIPRLSPIGPRILEDPAEILSELVSDDLETFFYNQTLDHFNYKPESYSIFEQRYVINSKYWGGANASAPILVYFGAEAPLDGDLAVIGFLSDNAIRFNALLLYIEHRYYGKSIPFGSREEALKNGSTLGYFTLLKLLQTMLKLSLMSRKASKLKILRLSSSEDPMVEYPHIALGALASSAPVLYFDDITPQDGYYSPRILEPLNDSDELKNYLDSMYSSAAQYNKPPTYPVNIICGGIDSSTNSENDTLSKIVAGLFAYRGNRSCYINAPTNVSETRVGWGWQTCSELVIRIGHDRDSMFPAAPFNLDSYIKDCKSLFGVLPQPEWVTTYYGGHDLKLILRSFASNIIFSNGLRDPYSSGGVLENISDSIVAISTTNGSHCLDLHQEKPSDPRWLVMQRKTEVEIIQGWISKYHDDLQLKDPKYIV